MKVLILTEKIDAGCQVGEALYNLGTKTGDFSSKYADIKKNNARKGYLKGGNYTIVWTNGHLGVDLKPSLLKDSYNLKFSYDKNFNYSMPSLLDEMKRVVKPDKKKLANQIKQLIKSENYDKVYICTDADAEGERIARDALFLFGGLKRNTDVRRMWVTGAFNTPKVIKEQLDNALPYNDPKYEYLSDSQLVRANGDFIQGMKSTKCLVDVYGDKLYSGRVKDTIIGLIGDRELEIKNFRPKKYYVINGIGTLAMNHFYFKDIDDVDSNGNLVTKQERTTHYFNEQTKDQVVKELRDVDLKGTVTKCSKNTSSSKTRPLPLSGDDFKSEMAKRYKLSLEESGKILQYLRYEGFTTYQGTNGRYFAKDEEDIVKTAYTTALNVFFNDKACDNAKFTLDAPLFNDAKAKKQNHPPLHLTDKVPNSKDYDKWANSKIKKVKEGYELIAKRIFVHFLEADSFETVKLEVEVNKHLFDLTGVKPIKQGWREFIGDKKANTYVDIDLKVGDDVKLDDIEIIPKDTTVPKLYTEGEILSTLMNVSKVLNNQIEEETDPDRKLELKKAKNILKNVEGIGTDRTREIILQELKKAGLINYTKKSITLTDSGWTLYNALPIQLRSVLFTALWEEDFEEIRRGNKSYNDVINSIDNQIKESIEHIIKNVDKSKVKTTTKVEKKELDIDCPICGAKLLDAGKVIKCEKQTYSNGKQGGCKFSFLKENKMLGRTITPQDLKNLIEGKELDSDKCTITLDLKGEYLLKTNWKQGNNNFNSNSKEFTESPKAFNKDGKTIWKDFRGKNITKAQAKLLFDGKKVKVKRKSKAGADYEIKIFLDDNGKIATEF